MQEMEEMNKANLNIIIRNATMEDVAGIAAISADVGWNQPEAEIREIVRRSGKYLLGAYHDGVLVGLAASCPFPEGGFANVNEVIVPSAWRGQGIATRLLNQLLPMVSSDYPVLRLCATNMGRPIYEKLGFFTYATLCFGELDKSEDAANEVDGIAPMSVMDLTEACELDAANFGAHRTEIVRSLLEEAPSEAWTFRRNGKLDGFIVRSPMNWFLQSRDAETFTALLTYAHSRNSKHPVLIRQEHVQLLHMPLKEHFRLTLMQYGHALPVPKATFSGFFPDLG